LQFESCGRNSDETMSQIAEELDKFGSESHDGCVVLVGDGKTSSTS